MSVLWVVMNMRHHFTRNECVLSPGILRTKIRRSSFSFFVWVTYSTDSRWSTCYRISSPDARHWELTSHIRRGRPAGTISDDKKPNFAFWLLLSAISAVFTHRIERAAIAGGCFLTCCVFCRHIWNHTKNKFTVLVETFLVWWTVYKSLGVDLIFMPGLKWSEKKNTVKIRAKEGDSILRGFWFYELGS